MKHSLSKTCSYALRTLCHLEYSVDSGQLSSYLLSFAILNLENEINNEYWETPQNKTGWSFTVIMTLACV